MVRDIWKLHRSDRIPLESLYAMEKFFRQDLERAQAHARELLKFRSLNLPRYRDMIQKALDEINESYDNIQIVLKKIDQMEALQI